jgi:hypothetical protein
MTTTLRILAGVFLTICAVSGIADAQTYNQTGWFVGAGPAMEWLVGDGYDLDRSDLSTTGYGINFIGGYAFTSWLSARATVSMVHHSGGVAAAVVDLIGTWPSGKLEPLVFARFGKMAAHLTNAQFDTAEVAEKGEWKGWAYGGGAGFRYWVSPKVTLVCEGVYTYVRLDKTVLDGFPKAIGKAYDGTTAALYLRIQYHW